MRRGSWIVVILLGLVLGYGQETAAPASSATVDGPAIDLLDAGDVPNGSPYADDVRAQLMPVTSADVASLQGRSPIAAPEGVPLTARTVASTADGLYVFDSYLSTSQGTFALWSVDRLTSAATVLFTAKASQQSDGFVVTDASAGPWTGSSKMRAQAADCTHCALVGGLASLAVLSPVCIGGGIISYFVCGLVGILIGNATTDACEAQGCSPPSYPSWQHARTNCSYQWCTYQLVVHNAGRSIDLIYSNTHWEYPPGFMAQTDNSVGYAIAHTDATDSWHTAPESRIGSNDIHVYTHYADWMGWTACASKYQVGISIMWSDYSSLSSGWVPGPKPFKQDCRGYRTYV